MINNSRDVKRFLVELPDLDGLEPVPTIAVAKGTLTLEFDYDSHGQEIHGGLVFETVRSYRYTAEGHCSAWQIEGAYDRLVEVQNSTWVEELHMAAGESSRDLWTMHHFMIYIGDSGCLEVASGSWSTLPRN